MASQYTISRERKELKRVRTLLAAAEARHANLVERGLRGSAEEASWHVSDLQETVASIEAWVATNAPTKFDNWSPARLQRHQQRHGA